MTLFLRFAVSRNPLSKSKNHEINEIRAFDFFLIVRVREISQMFQLQFFYRKMDARPFDNVHDILQCLSFAQSLFKDRNAPIRRTGKRRVNRYRNAQNSSPQENRGTLRHGSSPHLQCEKSKQKWNFVRKVLFRIYFWFFWWSSLTRRFQAYPKLGVFIFN